jgi:hypothetical protein
MTIRSGVICATLRTSDLDTPTSAEELINRDNTTMGINSERIEVLGSVTDSFDTSERLRKALACLPSSVADRQVQPIEKWTGSLCHSVVA